MEWIKWTKDTLPDPGQRVLIAYKQGLVGAIDCFQDQQHKDLYVKSMIWNEENPCASVYGPISRILKDISDSDPIIAWMPCPKAPNW